MDSENIKHITPISENYVITLINVLTVELRTGSVETMEYYTKICQSVDVVCYTSE
jgi:hypothetical protein